MAYADLATVLKDYENGVYDFTDNGKCIGCGNCCSNILPLSYTEITKIKEYIAQHNIKRQTHELFALRKQPDFDLTCPFLDTSKENNKCTIYPVRPLICQDFICAKGKVPDKELYYKHRKAYDMVEVFFDNVFGKR